MNTKQWIQDAADKLRENEQRIKELEAENQQLRFNYRALAKLVYDYLCIGEEIITKEELKDWSQKALDE